MEPKPLLIRCYLWAPDYPWSPELIEELLDELGGFLCDRGFSNHHAEPLCSVIVAGGVDLPDTVEEWMEGLEDDPAASWIGWPGLGVED